CWWARAGWGLNLAFLTTSWWLRTGWGLRCLALLLRLLLLPLTRPLRRRLLLLFLFALRRLCDDERRVARRGVDRANHDGRQYRPRQVAFFRVPPLFQVGAPNVRTLLVM